MLNDYLNFWKNLFNAIPLKLFDYMILFVFAIYIFEDITFGIMAAGISFLSIIASFFIGLAAYPLVSDLLSNVFSLPKGFADAIAFLVVTVVGFIVVSTILSILRSKYISIKFPKTVDAIGGGILGALSFFFIASFAVSLLLSFPTSSVIRDSIKNSVTGKFLSSNTQGIDRAVRQIFGGAIEDTINFLTVKPDSNQSVSLNFKVENPKEDPASEEEMIEAINTERVKRGVPPVYYDQALQKAARVHARDMLRRGYFSHFTPEGASPFDRMTNSNIAYNYAGENLAFAPDVAISMNGLMKSPGHRDNILNKNFTKVGVGVLDAGIYGKMYVQEFSD